MKLKEIQSPGARSLVLATRTLLAYQVICLLYILSQAFRLFGSSDILVLGNPVFFYAFFLFVYPGGLVAYILGFVLEVVLLMKGGKSLGGRLLLMSLLAFALTAVSFWLALRNVFMSLTF